MLRTDIGEVDSALRCNTDRAGCCNIFGRAGEFYFPNGTLVPVPGEDLSIRTYYRNRSEGFIRLHRRPNGHETGRFRCEIPDVSGTLVNLFINVGMYKHY